MPEEAERLLHQLLRVELDLECLSLLLLLSRGRTTPGLDILLLLLLLLLLLQTVHVRLAGSHILCLLALRRCFACPTSDFEGALMCCDGGVTALHLLPCLRFCLCLSSGVRRKQGVTEVLRDRSLLSLVHRRTLGMLVGGRLPTCVGLVCSLLLQHALALLLALATTRCLLEVDEGGGGVRAREGRRLLYYVRVESARSDEGAEVDVGRGTTARGGARSAGVQRGGGVEVEGHVAGLELSRCEVCG
jgi:hypothetical protein